MFAGRVPDSFEPSAAKDGVDDESSSPVEIVVRVQRRVAFMALIKPQLAGGYEFDSLLVPSQIPEAQMRNGLGVREPAW